MIFSIDKENKKIVVERGFTAPLADVWPAWTESAILDKWWAPKPWKAETKSMDFKEGGMWLYAMEGPVGEKHWARFDYENIEPNVSYSGVDAFCDEDGNINKEMGRSAWSNRFAENEGKTTVYITIMFDKVEDMEKQLEMGFKEGFTMGMSNLEELLAGKAS